MAQKPYPFSRSKRRRTFFALAFLPLLFPFLNKPTDSSLPAAQPQAAAETSAMTQVMIDESLARKERFAEYARRDGRKVFAVYLPWYGTEKNGWMHWAGFGHKPKGVFDSGIASVFHPLSGLYDSSDRRLIDYHIDLAKAAGIDGFIVDWYAGTVEHDRTVSLILERAERKNFTIAVMYETRLAERNPKLMKAHLRTVLERYAQSPAYHKVAGIPVLYVFGLVSTGFSVGDYTAVLKDLVEEGRKNGKNNVLALVGDSTQKPEYFNVASVLYEWINMSALDSTPEWKRDPQAWEHRARIDAMHVAKGHPGVFVAGSVYPGFDDAKLGGGDWGKGTRRFLDDQEGLTAQKTIDYAVEQKFQWTVVQTFNDWNEGTEFEPSVEKGFSRLWKVMELAARMKGFAPDPLRAVRIAEKFSRQAAFALDSERAGVIETARGEADQIEGALAQAAADARHPVTVALYPQEETE